MVLEVAVGPPKVSNKININCNTRKKDNKFPLRVDRDIFHSAKMNAKTWGC